MFQYFACLKLDLCKRLNSAVIQIILRLRMGTSFGCRAIWEHPSAGAANIPCACHQVPLLWIALIIMNILYCLLRWFIGSVASFKTQPLDFVTKNYR